MSRSSNIQNKYAENKYMKDRINKLKVGSFTNLYNLTIKISKLINLLSLIKKETQIKIRNLKEDFTLDPKNTKKMSGYFSFY